MPKNEYYRIPLAMFITSLIYMFLGLPYVIVAITVVTLLALIPDARQKEQEDMNGEN